MTYRKKFLAASLFLFLANVSIAMPVVPSTIINVVYPTNFDDDKCEKSVFSGTISSIALPSIPLSVINSRIEKDPVFKREALMVELVQQGTIFSSIRIEANDATLNEIQKNLYQGKETKLTEFERCAKSDKSLQLVELVNFTPSLKNLMPDLDSKIEFIKENDIGICTVTASKTLRELVKLYNPDLDLSTIEANIYFTSGGVSPDGSILLGKDVHIIFNKKDNIFDRISKPSIRIQVPAYLSYTVIQRLRDSGDKLQMTKSIKCKGQKPDNPVWIYDLSVKYPQTNN